MRFCYMELAESDIRQSIKIRDMAEINQYRKELRDKIIAYAMREFHQRGVKAVKMDEISRGFVCRSVRCMRSSATRRNCCLQE